MGSKMVSTLLVSGIFDGLSTFKSVPSDCCTWYTTVGAVVIKFIPYWRSKRSCTISICSKPKKPQRNPKPSACETSGSYKREASLSFNFSRDSRNWSYSLASTGYRPANTWDLTSLKPGNGTTAGVRPTCPTACVTVSPTFAAFNSLMPAMMKPTWPALSSGRSTDLGLKTPTCSTKWVEPLAIKVILSLGLRVPLITRTNITTPT